MRKIADLERRRSTAAAEAAAAAVTEAEKASRRPSAKKDMPLGDPSSEEIERTTITIPVSVLEAVDVRLARLGRRQRVSFSGYMEAALKELLARGEKDLEALERHGITKRRKLHGKTA
jgi:hypothetical protein